MTDRRQLRRSLQRTNRRRHLVAIGLVAPLFAFLVVFFVVPIGTMLTRSVDNREVPATLPTVAALIRAWDGAALPPDAVFDAMAADMHAARADRTLARAAQRLNRDVTGFRGLVMGTARRLPDTAPEGGWRAALIAADPAWGEPSTWHAVRRAAAPLTGLYLLGTVDLTYDETSRITAVPEDRAIYRQVMARTFWIAAVVTLCCLVLGYPLAYKLATLPPRLSNPLMILVLLPFWTSLLVRTAAWIVLLQREGMINDALLWTGVIEAPLAMVFNRFGVYVAMVHVLLPFMVLPLYSVMRGIPPTYQRAAESLGAPPLVAFLRTYLPLTVPGIGAGCLLVFIIALGYYITPALVGGADDQMISYFVAFFTIQTINWGMAAALGSLLLIATLLLYALYARLVGTTGLKLS